MSTTQTSLLVGVDIGTTRTKASVVGPNGKEICSAQVPTPWRAVPTGAETGAADILGAVVRALGEALGAAPPGEVVGLGVTSVAETVVLLGGDGVPVAPCIAWHDTRSQEESADLARVFGVEPFAVRTGLGEPSICSLAKLAWHTRHGGAPAQRAFSVADWVVYALGGEPASEASLASRTGALTLEGRQWWAEGLQWAGARADLFPDVVQAGQATGRVALGRLEQGLATAVPAPHRLARLIGAAVTSTGHDHLCAAAGVGAIGGRQVLDSCGTAEGFVRTVAPLDSAGVARAVGVGLNAGWHTVPGNYALLAGRSLGLLLERVLSLLGLQGPEAVAALDKAAKDVLPGPLRLSEAGPYGNVSVLGVSASSSPEALWSAALHHTAAGAAGIVQTMEAIAGPADELVLSGGWAHCTGVREGRQRVLPRTRWPAVAEAGARGAALFGGCAAGLFSSPADFPPPEESVLPVIGTTAMANGA